MANNITATALAKVQTKLKAMFPTEQTPSEQPLNTNVATFSALARNNRARVSPLLQDGACVAVNVGWQVFPEDQTADIDGDYDDVGTSCAVAEGDYPTTNEVQYDNNIVVQETVSWDDNLCGNLFNERGWTGHSTNPPVADVKAEMGAELAAGQIAAGLARVRQTVNMRLITYTNAASTPVNRDGNLPSYITFNATTDTFDLDTALMQNPRTLTDIDAIVQNNRMPGYFMLNGRRAWYNVFVDAQYRKLNDNEREFARMAMTDMYFDIRDMDATLGGDNSFAISRGAYAMWNTHYSGIAPERLAFTGTDEKWVFRMMDPDPDMRIWVNGSLQPVWYEIVFTQKCGGRRQKSQQFFTNFTMEITAHLGFQQSPAAPNGHTGFLHFSGLSGV